MIRVKFGESNALPDRLFIWYDALRTTAKTVKTAMLYSVLLDLLDRNVDRCCVTNITVSGRSTNSLAYSSKPCMPPALSLWYIFFLICV
jgi:hypothetical protein